MTRNVFFILVMKVRYNIYPSDEEINIELPLLRRYYSEHPEALNKYKHINGVVKIRFPFERDEDSWFVQVTDGVVTMLHDGDIWGMMLEPIHLMIYVSDIAPRPIFNRPLHLVRVARKREAEDNQWRVFIL